MIFKQIGIIHYCTILSCLQSVLSSKSTTIGISSSVIPIDWHLSYYLPDRFNTPSSLHEKFNSFFFSFKTLLDNGITENGPFCSCKNDRLLNVRDLTNRHRREANRSLCFVHSSFLWMMDLNQELPFFSQCFISQ